MKLHFNSVAVILQLQMQYTPGKLCVFFRSDTTNTNHPQTRMQPSVHLSAHVRGSDLPSASASALLLAMARVQGALVPREVARTGRQPRAVGGEGKHRKEKGAELKKRNSPNSIKFIFGIPTPDRSSHSGGHTEPRQIPCTDPRGK